MKKNLSNILKFLFFLGLGILLVWLAVKDKTQEELQSIKVAVQQSNYFWILLSFIISGFSHFFRATRWKIALEPLGHKPSTANAFFSVMIGYLANLGIPRIGEATRCGILSRYSNVPFVQGFGTVLAERALDVICVIVLFFLTLALEFKKISSIAQDIIFNSLGEKLNNLWQKKILLIIVGLSFLAITICFYIFRKKLKSLFSEKVKSFFKGLKDGLLSIKDINRPWLYITQTILIWLFYILQVYVVFFAFNDLAHLSFVVAMVITVFGALAVAVVPGGTGVYQVIVIQILTTIYFASESSSFALAWSVWASQIILILAGGLISLLLLPLINKTKKII